MCPPRCFSSLLLSHPRHCCRCCWVAKLHPTFVTPPGSSVHGISQARIPEWVAIFPSGGSSRPRDGTRVLLGSQTLCHWAAWEAPPHPQGENKNKRKARLEAGILGEGGPRVSISEDSSFSTYECVQGADYSLYPKSPPQERTTYTHGCRRGRLGWPWSLVTRVSALSLSPAPSPTW